LDSPKFFVRFTDSFVDGCLCNVVPIPGAALVTNPDQDRGATEDIALVGPLMESDQLSSLNQLAEFTKITYLHTIFVGHASLGKLALSLVSACELSHIKEPKLLVDFAGGRQPSSKPRLTIWSGLVLRAKGKIVVQYSNRSYRI